MHANENSPTAHSQDSAPLERVQLPNALTVWQSPLLSESGIVHAFTTRHGGASVGQQATLDLAGRGSREGADLATAEENYTRLRRALGLDSTVRQVRLHQVHGAIVHLDDGAPPPWPPPQGDIVISNRTDGLLMVRVADCAPVLLHDPLTGAVAAVHAGWRGAVADAPGAAVRAMSQAFGSVQAQHLLAAIGPTIGLERFEVGEEVAQTFRQAGLGAFVHPRQPKPHIDLFGAIRYRLLEAGVAAEHIDGIPICSFDNDLDCFSYRRDGPKSGRMAAVILSPGSSTLQRGNQGGPP